MGNSFTEPQVQKNARNAGDERRSDHTGLSSIVATAFDVSPKVLIAASRGPARVALARQTAIYLAHVVCGRNLSSAGRLYRRDRTTAAHACRVVEDRRDDQRFDALVCLLEQAVKTQVTQDAPRGVLR